MSVHIYNSLTRKKEEFIPLRPPRVNIYSCGVTVYNQSHIGHARSLYIFDLITRYLKYRGFKVKFVRNITDIDDKIINKAKESGISCKEVARKYIKNYRQDLKLLGIKEADAEPKATDNIKEMIRHIKALLDKGFAYTAEGDVYFKVRNFLGYGKLSGQSIQELEGGARIEPAEFKKDPLDFALWKNSKPGEPEWMSPWGKGRPGWHIECSAMSLKYLKTKTLDIHAGGRDLIFPHHENEIAQAQALTGEPFARYWIHHGLLTINGQKMAKSLGNFISVKDILKSYTADTLKMFFLNAHYASPIDFTPEKMREAAVALERIVILLKKINKRVTKSPSHQVTGEKFKEIEGVKNKFIEAIDDDFNTPKGLAAIFDLVNLANKNIDNANFCCQAVNALKEMLGLFGLALKEKPKASRLISREEIREKIKERRAAREAGNFALSDQIRKDLEAKSVILEDAKDGTTWRYRL